MCPQTLMIQSLEVYNGVTGSSVERWCNSVDRNRITWCSK